jgi:MFS family permease
VGIGVTGEDRCRFSVAGLTISVLFIKDTRAHVSLEAGQAGDPGPALSGAAQFARTSFRDPNLSSACQAGLVNNLNDAMAWGLLPLFFVAAGLPLTQVGILSAAYPAVWGLGQLITGWASDQLGRKWLIACGMAIQAIAIALIALSHSFGLWLGETVLLGAGTAMVYPTLLAAVGDASHPAVRASAIGTYRFWRDTGYAVGALVAGLIADAISSTAAIEVIAALTAVSAVVVAVRMRESARRSLRLQPSGAG